jgi:hypothetical protein
VRARNAVAGLVMSLMTVVAARPAAAQKEARSSDAAIKRIMALAARDLDLRRADLGLIGSTLAMAKVETPDHAASSEAAAVKAAVPAPVVSPAPVTTAAKR